VKGLSKAFGDAAFCSIMLVIFILGLNWIADGVWRLSDGQVQYVIGIFIGLFIGFRDRENVRHE
jgi:hypothetical protein